MPDEEWRQIACVLWTFSHDTLQGKLLPVSYLLLRCKLVNVSNIIKAATKHELSAIVRFLLTEEYDPAKIHHWMNNVYTNKFMSDGCV